MRKIFFLSFLAGITFSFAQEENRNVYEVSYLKVKPGMDLAFVEAVKKHNKTYHNKDKNVSAYLRQISHGHRSGEYLWIEGAMKMSLLDKKNDIKGHNEDWIKNIASKVISSDSNLYRNHPEYSSMSKSESGSGEIVFVRGFKHQNWKATKHILKRMKDMSDMSEGCNPYNVVTPIARSEGEPDFYIVRHLSSMGEFDEDDLFDKKNCNVFDIFQKEMSQEEMDNFGQMWQDNFEVVYSQFRTRVE